MQLVYKDSVRTSQETHYFSITKTNQLMLFRESVAVCCENLWNTQIHCVGRMRRFLMLKKAVYIATILSETEHIFGRQLTETS
jgi:hypothetical protein